MARSTPGDPVVPLPPGARPARLGAQPPPPQLATLSDQVPRGDGWIHEIKFDGYRILARIGGAETRLISRNGKDWTERFPSIARAAGELPVREALLDGEVVVLNEAGISDFQALQNAVDAGARSRLHYYVFDLLHLDGHDLRDVPQRERKAVLRELLERADAGDAIRYSDHVEGQGSAFYDQACAADLEGIISKRAAASYSSRRTRDWLKIKCLRRQEFVIVGYTEPRGSRESLGALLLAVHDDGRLVYAGKVGTGFTAESLRGLLRRLEPLERRDPAFERAPRGAKARDVHWVEPRLVAEAAFTEWTTDGSIRHPSFQGLREDKDPADVVRERPAARTGGGRGAERSGSPAAASHGRKGENVRIAGVALSSPDKVLWEQQGVTKLDLARYYEAVADAMLPHVLERPLTLVRCPGGAHGDCFFQKHWGEGMPEIVPRVMVEERDGTEPYMYIDGLSSVIALVQLGVLEFHVWGSRRDRLDRPDVMTFDIDPDEGLPWSAVQEAALGVRARLAGLGLESFAKTTGGKGLHVVVPLVRRADWDEVKSFSEAVAKEFVRREPKRYTAVVSKSARKGKVFLDYLRNAANSTAIAAYSSRARPGAPVSLPVSWSELESARERPVYTVRDAPARVARRRADPWPGWQELRQSITAAMLREVGLRR